MAKSKKDELAALREKYKDVLENKDLRDLCEWADPVDSLPGKHVSEAEYRRKCKKTLKILLPKVD